MHFELQRSVTYKPLCGEFVSQTHTQSPAGVRLIMSFSSKFIFSSLISTGTFFGIYFISFVTIKPFAPNVNNGILLHFTIRFCLKGLFLYVKLPYIVFLIFHLHHFPNYFLHLTQEKPNDSPLNLQKK